MEYVPILLKKGWAGRLIKIDVIMGAMSRNFQKLSTISPRLSEWGFKNKWDNDRSVACLKHDSEPSQLRFLILFDPFIIINLTLLYSDMFVS